MARSPDFQEAIAAYDNGDKRRALRIMEGCAETGDPVACFATALWYRNGEGAPADLARSDGWLAKLEGLAEGGNSEAQWEVGQNYRFGNLYPLDIERANHWLERSAEGGFGAAQHHLAWYLSTGQYELPVDPDAAAKWYQRAFDQEHPETLYMFAMERFHDGLPTQESIRLLKKAADKGFTQAADVLNAFIH